MPARSAPFAIALLLGCAACGVAASGRENRPHAWVARLGGPALSPDLPRVRAVAARLAAGSSKRLTEVLVAAHERPAAWSWSDGSIVLTERLLASLDDDELAAVLAHELGHLELERRPDRRALAGGRRGDGTEEAADDAGCRMLLSAGMDPLLMPCMLRHVAALEGADTEAGRSALRRAARLERALAERCRPTLPKAAHGSP